MRAVSRFGEGPLRPQYNVSARWLHQRSDVIISPRTFLTGAPTYIGFDERCRRPCLPLPALVAGISDCSDGRSQGAEVSRVVDRCLLGTCRKFPAGGPHGGAGNPPAPLGAPPPAPHPPAPPDRPGVGRPRGGAA